MKKIILRNFGRLPVYTGFFRPFILSILNLIFTVVLITGCVTMKTIKRDYCRGLDTYKRGYSDALNGQTDKSLNKDIKECAKYGVDLNQKEYKKGYKKGLNTFCAYNKGYEFGLEGKKYLNICPKNLEPDFFKGYNAGDKKCLYEKGYSSAANGEAPSFASIKCLKLSKNQSQKDYNKGRTAGLKIFCSYNKGYEFGLEGKKHLNICPKNLEPRFFKGYRSGDKKCLYEAGYSSAANGEVPSFASIKCVKLSKNQSQKEYNKGRTAGLKIFCSYKTGYNLGLNNGYYNNICPKNLEPNFYKGYTLGLQEYKAEQRQKEWLAIEQEKIDVERERTQQMLAIEQERIDVERERLEEQRATREDFIKLQTMEQIQLCRYDSDCHTGGECEYNFRLKDYVCRY